MKIRYALLVALALATIIALAACEEGESLPSQFKSTPKP